MKIRITLVTALLIISQIGFTQSGAYQEYQSECMGIELDGSQTIRAWGSGRNKTDAVEQAKKNAVRDVLFTGITKGNGGCEAKPLITEVNGSEKYQYYFNTFFKDGGEYRDYISMADRRLFTDSKERNATQRKYGVTVRVLRSELKQRLIQDNILKP